jgi:hypothetical protein
LGFSYESSFLVHVSTLDYATLKPTWAANLDLGYFIAAFCLLVLVVNQHKFHLYTWFDDGWITPVSIDVCVW